MLHQYAAECIVCVHFSVITQPLVASHYISPNTAWVQHIFSSCMSPREDDTCMDALSMFLPLGAKGDNSREGKVSHPPLARLERVIPATPTGATAATECMMGGGEGGEGQRVVDCAEVWGSEESEVKMDISVLCRKTK